jgi:hypothetical protein
MPPGNNFQRAADLDQLPPGKRDWTDSNSEKCQKAFVYYAVAVYVDVVSGNQNETPASSTSWSSSNLPCPATPAPVPPNVLYFKAAATNSADAGNVNFAGNGTYHIVAGTNFTLSWQVDPAATSVTLNRNGGGEESQPLQGSVAAVASGGTETYVLTATSAQGARSTVQLTVMP